MSRASCCWMSSKVQNPICTYRLASRYLFWVRSTRTAHVIMSRYSRTCCARGGRTLNRLPRKLFFLFLLSVSLALFWVRQRIPNHRYGYVVYNIYDQTYTDTRLYFWGSELTCWISIKVCQKRVFSQKHGFGTLQTTPFCFTSVKRLCTSVYSH